MILALDVGTSMTKGSLLTRDGVGAGTAERASTLVQFADGRVEQDLEEVLQTCAQVVRELAARALEPIEAIAITGQGDGLWLRDEHGRAVRPAISWMDARASERVRRWSEAADPNVAQQVYRRTGSGIFPGCAAALLAHLDEHEPESLHRAAVAGYCVDAIVQRLTGEITVDASDASLPFLDVTTRRYDAEALAACGLGRWRHLLAEPAAPDAVFPLSAAGAELIGLPAGTPVCSGPFDLPASGIGSGMREPGDGVVVVGTTLGCQVLSEAVRIDPDGEPSGMWLCSKDPDRYVRVMPGMVGTACLDWVLGLVGAEVNQLDAMLQDSAPGAGGVSALPFLSAAGERAPFVEPNARGLLAGLQLGTTRADVVRALCESVAYAARHCLEAAGFDGRLAACGGGVRSAAWCQIFADVIGTEIHIPRESGAGVRGAALAAWSALGRPVQAASWWDDGTLVRPDPRHREVYERGYAAYRERLAAARGVWSAA